MKRLMKAMSAIMLMTAMLFATGCNPEDDPNNNGGNNDGGLNGHEYVDLGLPSGLLWATCNLGATTPEGYGEYYAWGETETKSNYDWTTYKYCNGDYTQLTKYCNNTVFGYNGFSDTLTILQPTDDAAKVNMGGGWHIPSEADWLELLQNTTNGWATQNGVNGWLFTASNGENLFLPAAGCETIDGFTQSETYGYYWSNALYEDNPAGAWVFGFGSDVHGLEYFSRCTGRPVRAVCSPGQE